MAHLREIATRSAFQSLPQEGQSGALTCLEDAQITVKRRAFHGADVQMTVKTRAFHGADAQITVKTRAFYGADAQDDVKMHTN